MLSTSDYKRILEMVNIIYAFPDEKAMFATICERLTSLMGDNPGLPLPA